MAGDDRRVFLLAAEAAAGLHLHDANALGRQVEEAGQRAVNVVGTLHRAPHRHAGFGIGDGQHAVGLDVQLLLRAGLVLSLDDLRRAARNAASTSPRDTRYDLKTLSSPQIDLAAARATSSMVKTGGSGSTTILHAAARFFEQMAVVMREEHDRLFGMIDGRRRRDTADRR